MLAGIPLQVDIVAVVVITLAAIVHTPIALVVVPLVPSLKLPATSSFAVGIGTPIPIFHQLP